MNNEEVILQKLTELSEELKEFKKDFNIYQKDMAIVATEANHMRSDFNELKKNNCEDHDKLWNTVREDKKEMYKYIGEDFKKDILDQAQRNAKVLGLTAIVIAVVVPIVQYIIKGILK